MSGGLDDDEGSKMITLKSQDDVEVTVSKKACELSLTLMNALTSEDASDQIVCGDTDGAILKLAVDYLEHHQGTKPPELPKPLPSADLKAAVKDEWDATFIDGVFKDKKANLYSLVRAANWLGCDSLMHLTCAKIASLMKGQPLEKLKDILDPAKDGEGAVEEKAAE
jgi:S-phase kinase-associated protein 1